MKYSWRKKARVKPSYSVSRRHFTSEFCSKEMCRAAVYSIPARHHGYSSSNIQIDFLQYLLDELLLSAALYLGRDRGTEWHALKRSFDDNVSNRVRRMPSQWRPTALCTTLKRLSSSSALARRRQELLLLLHTWWKVWLLWSANLRIMNSQSTTLRNVSWQSTVSDIRSTWTSWAFDWERRWTQLMRMNWRSRQLVHVKTQKVACISSWRSRVFTGEVRDT